ncbi:hypothetical protein L596_009598 [Steinernema carpocapsae]|uniref:Uncharacterized protein n=1 Tax=Steinernema carpocapsae TaxID=34508 RepID=A0A4U5PG08_STECR|nr:hypothetical protein L596_009598 [Steinernema carpocapsae]
MSFYTPAQQAEAQSLLEISYALRSPKAATRFHAVQNFVRLLPRQIVAENAFVETVGALEEMPDGGRLYEAVQDAVAFLTLVIHSGNPFLTHQVEQMAQVGYFFNLLAKALQRGEEIDDTADELVRVMQECRQKVEVLEAAMKTFQEPLAEAREAVEHVEKLKVMHAKAIKQLEANTVTFQEALVGTLEAGQQKNEEIQRLRQELQASQALLEIALSCDADFKKLEDEFEKNCYMKTQLLATEKELEQEKKTRKKLEEDYDNVQMDLSSLREELDDQILSVQRQLDIKQKDFEEVCEKFEALDAQLSVALDDLHTDVAEKNENIKSLEEELVALRKENSDQRAKIEQLEAEKVQVKPVNGVKNEALMKRVAAILERQKNSAMY